MGTIVVRFFINARCLMRLQIERAKPLRTYPCSHLVRSAKTAEKSCAVILNKAIEQGYAAVLPCADLVRVLHRCGGTLVQSCARFFLIGFLLDAIQYINN